MGKHALLLAFFNKTVETNIDALFHLSDEENCVVFVDDSKRFGDIKVYEDDGELTVCFGRFTHTHFGCYRQGVSQDDAYEEITSDVIDTLRKVFGGELLFFGDHMGAGGYEPATPEPTREDWFADLERFAWPKSAR
jgi:hypothetical protein